MSDIAKVTAAFDRPALKRICEMHETDFEHAYNMTRVKVDQSGPEDFYFFRDNGANVLAVAHLDTVVGHDQRTCNFVETAAGPVVHSGALDDRLGAYIILELLPALGIEVDILLTVGEEQGRSTAAFFEASKEYHWMIEFDRGGTDVVLYQYEDDASIALVRACGARVGDGIFSDISYMEHLEIKGFNWGVGYQDYHSVRGYAYLEDTIDMVACFLAFHEANAETYLPHEDIGGGWGWRFDRDRHEHYFDSDIDGPMKCDACGGKAVNPETYWCDACGLCNACWYDTLSEECQCQWAQAEREAQARAEMSTEIEALWADEQVM